MVLIIKLNFQDFQNYREEFRKCLLFNNDNNYIKKIFVFTELNINGLPQFPKVKYFVRRDANLKTTIDFAKKFAKEKFYLYSNFLYIFTERELKQASLQNQVVKSDKWSLFFDNTDFELINLNPRPDSTLVKQNLELSTEIETTKNIIRKKGDLVQTTTIIDNSNELNVVIVSVNYNDFLLVSLSNNTKIFNNITIVTSPDDIMCQKICEKFGVNCIITERMYENGAKFNKGKAINEAVKRIEKGWILLLDADIVVDKKLNVENLDKSSLYTSDRYHCEDYSRFSRYKEGFSEIDSVGYFEMDRGLGFFQLYHKSKGFDFPESSDDAAWSDLMFRDKFTSRKKIENGVIHLGKAYTNWEGRKTERFLTDDEFNRIFTKQSTYTICSYYFNFRNDVRQKQNFVKFLEQFNGHYDKIIVGIVDYGDIDFEIPCKSIVVKGDSEKRIWSKEILINKIIDEIDTDYLIWIDGDLIYEDLSWLDNIDSVVKGNDFVQLFETINYLGENGEILETHKSIMSSGRTDIDNLLGEGYKPGGAWLGRTSILKEKKLFEQMYVGGGDTIFVYGLFNIIDGWTLQKINQSNQKIYKECIEWINSFQKYEIGFKSLHIRHLYHGILEERNYNNRYHLLSGSEIDKIVVFTENIGEYDNLHPVKKYENTRCIAFTDNDKLVDGWEIINVNNIEHIRNIKNIKLICKYIRTHPNEILPKFDYCIHIDANMILQEEPKKIIEEIKENGSDIMAFNHYKRNSIYEEAAQCIEWKLDSELKINSQIQRYKEEGLIDGLYECGFLVRRNSYKVKSFDEMWWEEILKGSYRDQISFPYVLKKSKINFSSFQESNRFNSRYLTINQNSDGSTHKGERVYNNNLIFIYEDSRANWGSTKMRGFDICEKIKCKIIPLSQSEEVKFKKIVLLKLSNYEKAVELATSNEIIIDMVDFNQFIHDMSIFKNFDYGLFTSKEQMRLLKDYFKYPEKCVVIYHHWDQRLKDLQVKDEINQIKICYFGQPDKCMFFGENKEIDYHQVDWYDFDEKILLLPNYNTHISVTPPKESSKIQTTTKISTAAALNCPIIINKDERSIELLGEDYPYYCNSEKESIQEAINKVKDTFLKSDWYESKLIMQRVKNATDIEVSVKKYLNI